jgi:hypothetical protein
MNRSDLAEHKKRFYAAVDQYFESLKQKNVQPRNIFYQAKIDEIIKIINDNKNNQRTKDPKVYQILNTFQTLSIGGVEELIKLDKNSDNNKIQQICAFENIFDEINKSHINTGHGGITKTNYDLKKKFDNIHEHFIKLYIEFCDGCSLKRQKIGIKGVVVKPIISNGFGSRGQIDLIDFQSIEYMGYKWVMHYQDHSNKFTVLEALTFKKSELVAEKLFDDVFSLIGAPEILQSDNGREFVLLNAQTLMLKQCLNCGCAIITL